MDKNCHITTVLHQNPKDRKVRGHIGTELTNKSEAVISVTKEKGESIVRCEQIRGREFKPFKFGIGMDNKLYVDNYQEKDGVDW